MVGWIGPGNTTSNGPWTPPSDVSGVGPSWAAHGWANGPSGGPPGPGGAQSGFPAWLNNSNIPQVVRDWFTQNWRPPVAPAPPPGMVGQIPGVAGPTLSGRQPLPVSPASGGLTQGTLDRMLAMTAAANARGASGPGGWGSARPDVAVAPPVSTMTGPGFDASGSLLRRSGPAPAGPPQSLVDKINAALAAAGQPR